MYGYQRGWEGRMNWEIGIDVYTVCVCVRARTQLNIHVWLFVTPYTIYKVDK